MKDRGSIQHLSCNMEYCRIQIVKWFYGKQVNEQLKIITINVNSYTSLIGEASFQRRSRMKRSKHSHLPSEEK